jgi:hypothetical protein
VLATSSKAEGHSESSEGLVGSYTTRLDERDSELNSDYQWVEQLREYIADLLAEAAIKAATMSVKSQNWANTSLEPDAAFLLQDEASSSVPDTSTENTGTASGASVGNESCDDFFKLFVNIDSE